MSCNTFDRVDYLGFEVDDYTKAIAANGMMQKEPRGGFAEAGGKQEMHQLYARRGKLYFEQKAFNLAHADLNKAIELAGRKAPPEYYIDRAQSGSNRAFGGGTILSSADYGHYLYARDYPVRTEALSSVADDYRSAISVTTDPFKLVILYIERGQLYYFAKDYGRAVDDFIIVERLLSTKRSSTDDYYQVWSALEQTYAMLTKEAEENKNLKVQNLPALLSEAKAKLRYWRDMHIEEYNKLEALRVENETRRKREHAAQCVQKANQAKAQARTCTHCNGSGHVLSYNAGTGNYQSSGSIEKGKMKWLEQKGQDSSWGRGNCPVCFGKGFVLPRIEGCDPRYLD